MSAGICLMNKNAIALAADSAVTIGNHSAIHNSANKLFSLSKYCPIGAIIYANANFMYMPMELLIKEYKKHLDRKEFKTLEEYFNSFLSFLCTHKQYFHFDISEKRYVQEVYKNLLDGLKRDYETNLSKVIDKVGRKLKPSEVNKIKNKSIQQTLDFIDHQETLPSSNKYKKYIQSTYSKEISDYLREQFDWINKTNNKRITSSICKLYDTKFMRNGYVGLALAGYGSDEIFPSMIHAKLGGIINDSVRYSIIETKTISEDNIAEIIPLAQTDVVQTFLFGINDNYINEIAEAVTTQIDKTIQDISKSCFVAGQEAVVQEELNKAVPEIVRQIAISANKNYMRPIIYSVATLPIEELSSFAESMINITSVRRQVALDLNIGTVGGPIDVAVISKGDGFIWLKRKHYFDIKYNPQYMITHYECDKIFIEEGENEKQKGQ